MPNCKNCSVEFEITDKHRKYYKRFDVPDPTHCPECRMQRRLSHRNDRSLFKSKSALSGKPMISMYDSQNEFVVYEQKEWWGDDWDPLKYGRVYDFDKPFFEQFKSLRKVVPRFNIFNKETENCEYVNYAVYNKNCYLLFGSWHNEDCMYGQTLNECKNCLDGLFVDKSELCYENIDCNENYGSSLCQNSSNLADCYFCFDCRSCKNCIGCWNLRNKEYHFLNKPIPKDEFEKIKEKFKSYEELEELKKGFEKMVREQAIHRDFVGYNNENVTGDFLFNCNNIEYGFSLYDSEDCAFSARAFGLKDSYDFEGGGKSELTYENMSNDFSYNSIGCTTCEHLNEAHYCDICFNCEYCIGCIGLRYKKYCILNKQYTKEEYEKLAPRVIEHMKQNKEWGEFWPASMSPFGYNETQANEYFPITEGDAQINGWNWRDESHDEKITAQNAIECLQCTRNFKITSQERAFYDRMHLPEPHVCPNCRHKNRMNKHNPRKLWDRKCSHCQAAIKTSYSPERPEKVFCEKCYLKKVY